MQTETPAEIAESVGVVSVNRVIDLQSASDVSVLSFVLITILLLGFFSGRSFGEWVVSTRDDPPKYPYVACLTGIILIILIGIMAVSVMSFIIKYFN